MSVNYNKKKIKNFTAVHIGSRVVTDKVIAEVKPDEKGMIVSRLKD